MIPVLTPAEMAEVDRNAPEGFAVLVDRAGTKVAAAAIDLMGGTYGRRVLIVAGPGNNGQDGRVAAAKLRNRGARVRIVDATNTEGMTLDCSDIDLIIDAAFGTGFRGAYEFPALDHFDYRNVPVLAVDIPSGISGLNGVASGRPLRASVTVTFAALKPGVLFGDGRQLSGAVRLVDIGLDTSGARMALVEDTDVARWLPRRPVDAHKWNSAVWLFAGSPTMTGAGHLSAAAALRAGAGYVRHSPLDHGGPHTAHIAPAAGPVEVVSAPLAAEQWLAAIRTDVDRFGSVAVGPGIGLADATRAAVIAVASTDGFPLVVDGDGLTALGEQAVAILGERTSPTVLTPHDREFERLTGHRPGSDGSDRIADVRSLAEHLGCVVLLKGPTTIVAEPSGTVLLSNSGDARLATAGTGDVLTGLVAAHLATGMDPLHAAVIAAFVHGRAGYLCSPYGMTASDLIDALPDAYTGILD